MSDDKPLCSVCGEPMQDGEEMFKFHGYFGPCPKPPLPRQPTEVERLQAEVERLKRVVAKEFNENDELGAEYTYVNILKDQLTATREMCERLSKQIICNITFHELGGIDDCEPCKALAAYEKFKKEWE